MNDPYWQFMIEQYRSARRCSAAYCLQMSGRLFRQLRREFAWRLAKALGKRAEQMRGPIAAVWYDALGRIGNAQIVAHMAPQSHDAGMPLILRIAVNSYGVRITRARADRLGCPWDLAPEPALDRPRFELSTTPEETLDFVPWVAGLVERHERGSSAPFPEPPHPCDAGGLDLSEAVYLWTRRAWDDAEAYENERKVTRTPFGRGTGDDAA